MELVTQLKPQPTEIPGVAHVTLAGHAQGMTQLSIWKQTLAAGASTPPHQHTCDEVVLCLGGGGEVHSEGRVERFRDGDAVLLPTGRAHQIFNVCEGPLHILGVFSASPVETWLPDGTVLALPWES